MSKRCARLSTLLSVPECSSDRTNQRITPMPRTSKPTTKRAPAKRKTTKMRKGKGPTLAAQLALFNALLEDIITAIAGLEQSNAQRHKALLDRLPPKPTLAHALEGAAAF